MNVCAHGLCEGVEFLLRIYFHYKRRSGESGSRYLEAQKREIAPLHKHTTTNILDDFG